MYELTVWHWLAATVGVLGLVLSVFLFMLAWKFCDLCGKQERKDWLE